MKLGIFSLENLEFWKVFPFEKGLFIGPSLLGPDITKDVYTEPFCIMTMSHWQFFIKFVLQPSQSTKFVNDTSTLGT